MSSRLSVLFHYDFVAEEPGGLTRSGVPVREWTTRGDDHAEEAG